MVRLNLLVTDRRSEPRFVPEWPIQVYRAGSMELIGDAQVLDVSAGGAAFRTRTALNEGEQLAFTTEQRTSPIIGEVLACQPLEDGYYHVRCRCLVGGFGLP